MQATALVHDVHGVSAETRTLRVTTTPSSSMIPAATRGPASVAGPSAGQRIGVGASASDPAADSPADTHALGEAIASLAAGIHAATFRLLTLLREFDARLGWNNGFVSCAHWLHWRTGIDLGASREKVRVARALAALPRISWAMEHGQLSYAKVRALTRVATAENESALLDVALCATAAHVERFVRGWRRVDRASEARDDERRHLNRELRAWVDDDGMVVLRGRLTPEAGAVVMRALEAAADRLFVDARSCPTGNSLIEEVTPAQRRADALALVGEAALAGDLDRGTAEDRYQVVMHVDGAVDAGGVLELDHGVQRVSAETPRRLSCDASVVVMPGDGDGDGPDHVASRRTRTIPSAVRRALAARSHVPLPRLHVAPVRRAPHRALGRWRRVAASESRVAVPATSSRGARRWLRCDGRGRRRARVLAAGWRAAARVAVRAEARDDRDDGSPEGVGWHAIRRGVCAGCGVACGRAPRLGYAAFTACALSSTFMRCLTASKITARLSMLGLPFLDSMR